MPFFAKEQDREGEGGFLTVLRTLDQRATAAAMTREQKKGGADIRASLCC